jgi:DNA-binding MarR family transcriptional regulator
MVSNQVSHRFAQALQKSGVTVSEWVVLRQMYGQPAKPPSLLAQELVLTRGAISKLADRLLEKQLIARRGNGFDRRFQSLELTKSGRDLVPALAALADANDEHFFQVLPTEQRQELLRVLKVLAQAHEINATPLE